MNRIKELREKKQIKQMDLAKKLEVTQGTLSNWERGKHDLDNNTLIKLSNFFDVTTDYLLGKVELKIPEILSNVQIAFNRGEFEDLTQEEVDALAIIAKTLKSQRREV